MPNSKLSIILLLSFFAAVALQRAEARSRFKGVKSQVRFVASSWFIRGTAGLNKDIYLVEITADRHAPPLLAQLVDNYPNEAPPLPLESLNSQTGTMLRVRRDMQCDIPFGQIALRTAPGDPRAVLLERFAYSPKLTRTPEQSAIIPCFQTVRR